MATNSNISFDDLMKNAQTLATGLEARSEVKAKKIKGENVGQLMSRIAEGDRQLVELKKATGSVVSAGKRSQGMINETQALDIAGLLSNVDTTLRNNRTDEGIKACKAEMIKVRKLSYDSAHNDNKDAPRGPVTEKNPNPAIHYSKWEYSAGSWRVGTQLIDAIAKFGWKEVVVRGVPVPYKEHQHWHFNEDGELVKEKATKEEKAKGPRTDIELVTDAVLTLEKRMSKKGFDPMSSEGEAILNRAMLVLANCRATAIAKSATEK